MVCNGIDGSTSMKFMSHEIHLARIRCVIQIPKRRETNDGDGISVSQYDFQLNITLMILFVYCILILYKRVLTRFIYFIFFIISSTNFSFCFGSFKFLWLQTTYNRSANKKNFLILKIYQLWSLMLIISFSVSH